MKAWLAAALWVLSGTSAWAHRVDEYLQGTLLTLESGRVGAEMRLTPGVAVFPSLLAQLDLDGDGVISGAEQGAYAGKVLGDLVLAIDGRPLRPKLVSAQFPTIDEMREGRGEIVLGFEAELPRGGHERKLTLENRHESRVAAYQVNCLVPRDGRLQILAQKRNYSQSVYELDFADRTGGGAPVREFGWAASAALLMGVRLLIRRRGHGPGQ